MTIYEQEQRSALFTAKIEYVLLFSPENGWVICAQIDSTYPRGVLAGGRSMD